MVLNFLKMIRFEINLYYITACNQLTHDFHINRSKAKHIILFRVRIVEPLDERI